MPRLIVVLLLALLCLFPHLTHAQGTVFLPTGEYRVTVTDLRIKVRNGVVVFERSWLADDLNRGVFRWHPNPAWDDLRFELDVIDGVPKTILRSGSRFERSGNGVYVFDRQYFIRAEHAEDGTVTGWRWYDRSGQWIHYDAAGRIERYGDRNGLTVRFSRTAAGRIDALWDRADALIARYSWSGEHLQRITDRADRRVEYGYSGDLLSTVTDVLGKVWRYDYQGGLLHRLSDPEGHTTTVEYSGNRVVQVIDALQQTTRYRYTWDRVQREYGVVIRSPENRRRERRYDADGRLIHETVGDRLTQRTEKDGEFVETHIDERGLRTRTEYDANRHPVRVLYPDGSETRSRYDGTYGNLLEYTDERGVRSTWDYDSAGRLIRHSEAIDTPAQRITEYTYNAHGERIERRLKGPTTADDVVTAWTYDADGNVASLTDAEQHLSTFTWHVSGSLQSRTDALDHTWQAELDAAGRAVAQRDPLNQRSENHYDGAGNRIASVDASGARSEYHYDALNRLWKTVDPLGGEQISTYTADGQIASQQDETGANTRYSYDSDGRLSTITDPAGHLTRMEYGDAASGLAGLLIAIDYPTYREEYRYDARGRRTQSIRVLPASDTQPEQRLTQASGYDAAGHRIADTDPAGRSTLYRYDALGRLSRSTDALGGHTDYSYDARDNLISLSDANQHTHTFVYDHNNQLIRETRPSGTRIRYQYDPAGRLTERRSPSGERRVFGYDAAGNKTDEHHYAADAEEASETIHYQYDPRGLLQSYQQTSDPGSPDEIASSADYRYNRKGEKTDETIHYRHGHASTAATQTHHLGRRYRANGQLSRLIYPGGEEIAYTYDAYNRLIGAELPDGGQIEWPQWQWQQPTRVQMPGAVRTLEYDALQRPIHLHSQALGSGDHQTPNGPVLMAYRYRYDAAGNLSQRETEDGVFHYAYDALDRLSAATPPSALQPDPAQPAPAQLPVEAYSYDPVHNRQSSQHQPGLWQYNADNQLLSYGLGSDHVQLDYNANGHTARETRGAPSNPMRVRDYHYNAAERLRQIDDNGHPLARYHYDPQGRRIRQHRGAETVGNASTTWYLYSDEGLLAELDGDGQPQRYYGWKPQNLWGTDPLWLADRIGGEDGPTWQVHTYHNDHLWTPQRLSDRSGTLTWSARSEAFGKTHITVTTITNPLRFPGQYEDPETGTHYNYHRDYLPGVGRYLEEDPIGLEGGVNQYSYANSNAIFRFDTLGLSSCCDRARERGLDNSLAHPGEKDRGFVVCCDGKKHACYNVDRRRFSDPVAFFGVSYCGVTHELDHFEEISCPECGVDRPLRDSQDIDYGNNEECKAYAQHLSCLKSSLRNCTSTECKSQIGAEISRVRRAKAGYCNG